jgi:hypothetical protein
MLQVLLGVVDDEFQRFDLMFSMLLVETHAADHALLHALRLQADQVEDLAGVALAFGALWVFELQGHH